MKLRYGTWTHTFTSATLTPQAFILTFGAVVLLSVTRMPSTEKERERENNFFVESRIRSDFPFDATALLKKCKRLLYSYI